VLDEEIRLKEQLERTERDMKTLGATTQKDHEEEIKEAAQKKKELLLELDFMSSELN